MRKTECILVGLALLAAVAAAATDDSESRVDVVRTIERRYGQARSFEADFVQRYTRGATTLIESGHVYFKKPGRMRWEYTSPEGKLFLVEGDYAYLYVPAEALVRRYRLKKAPQWQAAFSLLLEEEQVNFEEVFDEIRVHRVHSLRDPARWQLRGLPRSDKQAFTEIWLDVNDDYQITRVEIRQADGSLMEFHFRRWQENRPISADLFELQVPPGTAWVTQKED